MKRTAIIILSIIYTLSVYPQASAYYVDGIRLSENFYGSTARVTAMSGAFGALGGDLGSISINPAAVGVFRKSEFSFSPSFESLSTSSTYLNHTATNPDYRFYFGNIGAVYTHNTDDQEGWSNFNLAFGYNKLADYNSSYTILGNTTDGSTSLTNEFLYYSNRDPNNLDFYHEALSYDAGIIVYDTVRKAYISPFQGVPITQRQNINMTGHSGEAYVAFGANYGNTLYLGAVLNFRSVYYREDYSLTETDNTLQSGYQYYTFDHSVTTSADGVNLKIGAIYKPTDFLRIGGAIQTPTYMQVNQESNSHLLAVLKNGDYYDLYPSDNNYVPVSSQLNSFTVTTPFRAMGSLALISPEIGLLSVDYEFADYRSINFSNGDDQTGIQYANDGKSNYLRATNNIRVGAEARLGSLYLRGGYGYYQSPYTDFRKNDFTGIYSGGLGYRNNNFYFDFAYSMQAKTETYYMYDDAALTAAKLNTNTGRFITTLGFKF